MKSSNFGGLQGLVLILSQSLLTQALPYESASSITSTVVGTTTETPETTLPGNTVPGTTGTFITSLETAGRPGSQPFATTDIPIPTTTISPLGSAAAESEIHETGNRGINGEMDVAATTRKPPQDAFLAITNAKIIPTQVTSRGDHPIPTLGVSQTAPISTNKFFGNFYLGSQGSTVFTHPYGLQWSKGNGNAGSYGMAISQVEESSRAYGARNTNIPGSPVSYYINAIGIQSMILSATELKSSTVMTMDSIKGMSANVNLSPSASSTSKITMPLVQGMGFVTGIYTNLQPEVQSSVFFRTVTYAGTVKTGIYKYQVTLEDGKSWLVYAQSDDGTNPSLTLVTNTLMQGTAGWSGIIQIAKNPEGTFGELYFDSSAGAYATACAVSGSVSGTTGTYKLTWTKGGLSSATLLMFALPHHIASLTSPISYTTITLPTTTKGNATAVIADSWTLTETDLPIDMGWAPWTPALGSLVSLSSTAKTAISSIAAKEVSEDMDTQSNLDSMYYSGKALAKFAQIVYVLNDLLGETTLAAAGLKNLKKSFSRFVNNTQIHPLVYDTVWKGIVSSATYTTGDTGVDFGNSCYNDHHFHYGYFIYAASIIAHLDSKWIPANKDWVNMLVRDTANPIATGDYFPFSRNFDWFHGHSWAKGLFDSGDSKDEESSSEDVMFAYGMKLWGKVIGDASMEVRGNLMLGILKRSLQSYFYMESSNVVQPSNFIANKVTGILFENKVDHTTYFGANFEYVQGIHMIPLLPCTPYIKSANFVAEEWSSYFSETAIDPASTVEGGWRGILYANLAMIEPQTAWNFFAQTDFNSSFIDGGASRTWYLAYCAGLGGQ